MDWLSSTAVDPFEEAFEVLSQVLPVGVPRHPVYARSRLRPNGYIRPPEAVEVDVVQQRREPCILSLRATSRTRSNPLDTSGPALRPGRGRSFVFPLASPLSSTASATGLPALFGGFVGTTGLSDFPRSCISG